MSDRNFVAFQDAKGNTVFFNVDQIRVLTLSKNGVRIVFSEEHEIQLDGPSAGEFVKRLAERSTSLNGEPIDLAAVDLPMSE